MESAHSHHQLQDQLVASSASSLAPPSCYGVGFTTHAWTTPISFLNTNNGFNPSYSSETLLTSRETRHQENTILPNSHYTSMAADLGFNWANNTAQNFTTTTDQCEQDLHHTRIKEELTDLYYRKYTSDIDNEQRNLQQNDLTTKLLLKSSNLTNKIQLPPLDLYSDNVGGAENNGRGFCQIFPSVNVSSLNQMGLTNARALDMNLEAVDALASSRFSGNFVPSSHNQTEILRDGFSFGFDHMQPSLQIPFFGSNKVSSASSNAVVEATKRNSNKMEPKALIQNAPKKSRLEARSSCPPFKVRKEKLGDRIAALQQLVAPFGKTDTASVLMEAIGYIKFLQNQVETLSVPYMKASQKKTNRVMKAGPAENENEVPKRDLKSLGLCLVPLSCLSYITEGGGAAVWPPPHFGGAT